MVGTALSGRVLREPTVNVLHPVHSLPHRTLPSLAPLPHRVALATALAVLGGGGTFQPVGAQESAPPTAALDRVILRNGNIIDGEVKSMSRGKLQFDTDAMNIVSIER